MSAIRWITATTDGRRQRVIGDLVGETSTRLLFVIFVVYLTSIVASAERTTSRTAAGSTDDVGNVKDGDRRDLDLEELDVEVVELPADCGRGQQRKTRSGDMLKVHYAGFLAEDQSQFDASKENAPFVFQLGAGRVIRGWDRGLVDMCVGERRRLTIPPHLGYGSKGFGAIIGPNAKLIFDVELVDIIDQTEEQKKYDVMFEFSDLDLDNDGLLSREEVMQYMWAMGQRMEEIAMQMETLEASRELIDKIMNIHDLDRDGFLDEKEFYRGSGSAKSKKEEL